MKLIKKIWIIFVRLCGWKLLLPEEGTRSELNRCVFVVAPHTSAQDFIFGAAFLWACCSNGKVMIKKEFFFWPLGCFLRAVGCIRVDRGNKKNELVDTAVEAFKANEFLSIAMTPEATRKPRKVWKKGFWEIAKKANVPIVPAYLDFKNKTIGVFDTIYPSGDYDADLKKVRSLYKKEMAKYPEMFLELNEA